MAAVSEINIAGPKLSEDECGYLRNKKGKFVTKKTVAKSVCSANKLIQARKSVEKRRLDDDAPTLAIDDFLPRKKTRRQNVVRTNL